MINVNFGPNIFLGIIVSVGVLILYSLRNVKPEIARDEDIFFSTVVMLYSGILAVHGWRLGPILLFGQALISACSGFAGLSAGLYLCRRGGYLLCEG